jgi:hypothetical protein
MAGIRLIFNVHRNWEDWVGMLLGVLIGLSPWLVGQQDNQIVMWNAVIVGALVIALSALELSGLQRWEENRPGGMRAVTDRIAIHLRLCRDRRAPVLAFRLRGRGRADCRVAAVAGLEAQRQGARPARAVTVNSEAARGSARAGTL